MKKFCALIGTMLFCLLLFPIRAQAAEVIDEQTFPDPDFRSYVADFLDDNGDGTLTNSEIAAVTYMDLSEYSAESLKGIEVFTNLSELNCSQNMLKTLDLSQNPNLVFVECSFNRLKTLKVPAGISTLLCCNNQLKSLNVTGCKGLRFLDCSDNQLTALDVSGNKALNSLFCSKNKLTKLVMPAAKDLDMLTCYGNALKTVDISKCPNLIYAYVYSSACYETDYSYEYVSYTIYGDDLQAANAIQWEDDEEDWYDDDEEEEEEPLYLLAVDSTMLIKATPFTDVSPSKFYQRAVAWANYEGITKGKTSTTFAPSANLTRGEFCTMLWRMFGKPNVTDAQVKAMPFADAKASNHKKAIAWCYRQGIIKGYTQSGKQVFLPSRSITRGNILVMLFKLAKKEPGYEAPTIKNPFDDVKNNNSNLIAYRWAYENELTTTTVLKPGDACKRSAMVSFLYGYNNAYDTVH